MFILGLAVGVLIGAIMFFILVRGTKWYMRNMRLYGARYEN